MQAENALDLAKDYTALMVIANFDDFYYDASRLNLLKEVLEEDDYAELFKIETTTSYDAYGEKGEDMKEDLVYAQVETNAGIRDRKRKQDCLDDIRDGDWLSGRFQFFFYKA